MHILTNFYITILGFNNMMFWVLAFYPFRFFCPYQIFVQEYVHYMSIDVYLCLNAYHHYHVAFGSCPLVKSNIKVLRPVNSRRSIPFWGMAISFLTLYFWESYVIKKLPECQLNLILSIDYGIFLHSFMYFYTTCPIELISYVDGFYAFLD